MFDVLHLVSLDVPQDVRNLAAQLGLDATALLKLLVQHGIDAAKEKLTAMLTMQTRAQ